MMVADHNPIGRNLETLGAWTLGVLWMLPLLYAVWTAFHPAIYATHFDPLAPITLANLEAAWQAAPFTRYLLNTVMLVTLILAAQFVLCTLAAFAFARLTFPGRDLLFAAGAAATHGDAGHSVGGELPHTGEAAPRGHDSGDRSAVSRLRLRDLPAAADVSDHPAAARRCRTTGRLWTAGRLWRVYVPLARPTYIAYGLVSVSYHWNNFLWPLVITNSVTTRPLTVGLAVFATTDQGIDWSIVTAATLMTSAPLLVAFLLFQRQFVQSFMRAGIR